MARSRNTAPRWLIAGLLVLTAGVIVLAVTALGAPTTSSRTSRQLVTATDGIVQTTVSATGNIQPATDVAANFATSGTLSAVYVKLGQHVTEGEILAELDPTSAQLAVDQANASLNAARLNLTAAENGQSTGGSGGGSSGGSSTAASLQTSGTQTEFVAFKRPTSSASRTAAVTRTVTATASRTAGGAPAGNSSAATTSRTTTTTTTTSPAAIASAEAAVLGAESNLQTAQAALARTRLTAPASGTIASLSSLQPGETVSAGSGSNASGSSSGSSGSASSGSTSGSSGSSSGSGSAAGSLGSSSSSSSSSGTSSAFAEIIDTSALQMTVAFSESDITKVKVGQPVTVTLDALSGVELAGHVSAISPTGTTSSSVVSYDATLTLDQTDSRVRPGMSASATVIVAQAHGVTLPNEALTGSGAVATVQLMKNGHAVSQPVITGLRGTTRTQIVSGLASGQQVVVTISLPSLGASSTSTSGTGTSGFGSRFRTGGFGTGGGGFGGAGAGGGLGGAGPPGGG